MKNSIGILLIFWEGLSVVAGCSVGGPLVLDIPESIGTQTNQATRPEELPLPPDSRLTLRENPFFTLDQGPRLKLRRPLDRETTHGLIRLQLECQSNVTKRTIPVVVRVLDINDHTPEFHNFPADPILIPEDSAAGSVLVSGLTARDSDPGSRVEYRSDHPAVRFPRPHVGTALLAARLDFETEPVLRVPVVASDQGGRAATATLTVSVLDVDDQDPAFDLPGYQASIPAGPALREEPLEVQPRPIAARDLDTLHSPVTYSLDSVSPRELSGHFSVDSATGLVRQLKAVRLNVTDGIHLFIKATEAGGRSSRTELTVKVEPGEPPLPRMTVSSNEGWVQENSPPGTPVLDKDGRSITFSTGKVELTTEVFTVGVDSVLRVAPGPPLDRDPPRPSRHAFQATMPGSAPLAIVVHVTDDNDHAPLLPSLTRLQVPADARHITKIEARDPDEGDIRYSIYHVTNGGEGLFSVDPWSGNVEATGPLRPGSQYSVTLQATDPGGKFSQTILDVVVGPGENLEPPAFSRPSYHVAVMENGPLNSPILTLAATDPEGERVTYQMTTATDLFDLGPSSGILRAIRSLDRESASRYQLLVRASDPGNLWTEVKVVVTVDDQNDNSPAFNVSQYFFSVPEGEAPGFIVGRVSATDLDDGLNGEIVYSTSEPKVLTVDPKSGQLALAGTLDYERAASHTLTVTATDLGPERRQGSATVVLAVKDVEDERPRFVPSDCGRRVAVAENDAPRDLLAVRAVDPDSRPRITYRLSRGNSTLFAVDSGTGTVRTRRPLDYESTPGGVLELAVGTAEDPEGDTCSVRVSVTDVNDHAPQFAAHPLVMRLHLRDDSPPGTAVATVGATDADGTAPNNVVTYFLEENSRLFRVNQTSGEVQLAGDLGSDTSREHQVTLLARDGGLPPLLSSPMKLIIMVDHVITLGAPPPALLGFLLPRYNLEVHENSPSRTLVAALPVANVPGYPVTCSIVMGNEEGHFMAEFGPDGCALRTKDQGLDFERRTQYNLTLRLDGLHDGALASTSATVDVLNVNDNPPQFTVPDRYRAAGRPHGFLAGMEPGAVDVFLAVLQARDVDVPPGGLRYGSPDPRVAVHPTSGEVRSTALLQPLALPVTVPVAVTDGDYQDISHLLVNAVRKEDHVILAVGSTSPLKVFTRKEELLGKIQELSGMVAELIAVKPLRVLRNGSLETDVSGCDVILYLLDPVSWTVIPAKTALRRLKDQPVLLPELSRVLEANVEKIREPLLVPPPSASAPPLLETTPRLPLWPRSASTLNVGGHQVGYSLIALAAIILVVGLSGIIYHCVLWARYTTLHRSLHKVLQHPNYEPFALDPAYNKEYETQVLQMSVAFDDDQDTKTGHLVATNKKEPLKPGHTTEL